MDTEKSISELIREAREDNNKLIVLLAGEATEKSMLAIARVANKIKEEIVFISVDPQKVLADIKEIAQFKDIIVCVDDINSAMMNIPRTPPRTLKLTVSPRMAELDYEPFLVSAKKEYGVSKNKKSFSPPKNKGFNKGKVVLRGRHR